MDLTVLRGAAVAIVLVMGSGLLGKEAMPTSRVYLSDGKLMISTGGQAKMLAEEQCSRYFSSPTRTFFIYEEGKAGVDHSVVVLETLPSGALVRQARVKSPKGPPAWMSCDGGEVLDKDRVFLYCTLFDRDSTPELGVEYNMKSGTSHFFKGDTFAWNKAKSKVAYFRYPHADSPDKVTLLPTEVYVGRTMICKLTRRNGEFLQWANDEDLVIQLGEFRPSYLKARLQKGGTWKVKPAKASSWNEPEVHDLSAGKWVNAHEGDPQLVGVRVQQFPDCGGEEYARYEGRHPAMIIYVFKDGRANQVDSEPNGTITADFWYKLEPHDLLWETIEPVAPGRKK